MKTRAGLCECEHAEHFDGCLPERPHTAHGYRKVPAGGARAAQVGAVCDACAVDHLAGYVTWPTP